ncbi:DUF6942 family protein (plasmid) [Pseudoalteromonas sp. T1lg65]|uniref:DUF6942 family protein n=1 Tax=Pseudoalteromonas sp. T1lg65 TaxID=2077101 RepID=UPI003F7B2C90
MINTTQNKKILTRGFGVPRGKLAIYIEHPPKLDEYLNLNGLKALGQGELEFISNQCGNGWRKIFNVYAKILDAIAWSDHNFTNHRDWQDYRDKSLLQAHSQEALLFSSPDLQAENYDWHIIAGRTYAKSLLRDHIFTNSLVWLDAEFAIDTENHLIICPFLDYRQLSNLKIKRLAALINEIP